jgi:hypothetical protein
MSLNHGSKNFVSKVQNKKTDLQVKAKKEISCSFFPVKGLFRFFSEQLPSGFVASFQ